MTNITRTLSFAGALALAALTPASSGAQSAPARPMQAPTSEEAAARVPLEAYLRGHATGDSAVMRRAFWKEARLWSVRDGQLATRTADEYIAAFTGSPAADEAQRKRRIVSLEISGNAAIAVIDLDYPQVHFTDYMTLLKVGEEWRIINKSFYADRRAPAPAVRPDLSGAWDFAVEVGTGTTRGEMVLRWGEGSWTGTLTPAGTNTLPIASFTLAGEVVRLVVTTPEGPVQFDGTIDAAAREMRGTVTYHHGEKYPLSARRR